MELKYSVPNSEQIVVITQRVCDHFFKYSQKNSKDLEAGGQLFAKITKKQILIKVATGPRKTDYRTRFGFIPDRIQEILEIKCNFRQELHYVGEWHTHPETIPTPSPTDITSIKTCFQKSKHELQWFLMIIVGTKSDSLYVGKVNSISTEQLKLIN